MLTHSPSRGKDTRRTRGLFSRLVSPLLYAADDAVETFRNAEETKQDRGNVRAQSPSTPGPSGPVLAWTRSLPGLGYLPNSSSPSVQGGPNMGSLANNEMSPTQLKRRQVSVQRGESFVKLGIAFEKLSDSGLYIITSVSPNGPAYKKLRVGDVLQSVDGVPLRNKTLSEIVALLSGELGSMINFEVISAGDLSSKQPSPSTGTKEASLKMLSIPRGPENSDHPHDGRRGNSDIGLLLVKDTATGKIVVRECSRQGTAFGQVFEGQEIFAVDGVAISGKGADEAMDLMCGPPGKIVNLIVGPVRGTPPRAENPRDSASSTGSLSRSGQWMPQPQRQSTAGESSVYQRSPVVTSIEQSRYASPPRANGLASPARGGAYSPMSNSYSSTPPRNMDMGAISPSRSRTGAATPRAGQGAVTPSSNGASSRRNAREESSPSRALSSSPSRRLNEGGQLQQELKRLMVRMNQSQGNAAEAAEVQQELDKLQVRVRTTLTKRNQGGGSSGGGGGSSDSGSRDKNDSPMWC